MLRRLLQSTGAPHFSRESLRKFEHVAVPVMHAINANTRLKQGLHPFMYHFTHNWVSLCTDNLWELHGLEHVRDLDPPQGVVLVSNHRSFFDMYMGSAILYRYAPHFMQRIFFPVRKDFFYDRPLGLVINLTVSGASMWPPVFRDDRKSHLNKVGMQQMGAVLVKGAVLGIHPEGRRGSGEDPWQLLPAKPGLGRLLRECHPDVLVLPFFTLGASNDVKLLISRNFKPAGERGQPVRYRFAAPMRAADLLADADDMQATSRVMDVIARLAAEDRADWQANPRVV